MRLKLFQPSRSCTTSKSEHGTGTAPKQMNRQQQFTTPTTSTATAAKAPTADSSQIEILALKEVCHEIFDLSFFPMFQTHLGP